MIFLTKSVSAVNASILVVFLTTIEVYPVKVHAQMLLMNV